MKIYDIVTSKSLNEGKFSLGSLWADFKASKAATKEMAAYLQKVEPFLQKSSNEYADAVISARSAGKSDPKLYDFMANKLPDEVKNDPEKLKAVLADIDRRAQSKVAGRMPGAEAEPETMGTRLGKKEKPTNDPQVDNNYPDFVKNEKIPREKIDKFKITSEFEKVVGNSANLFKYFGVYELSLEMYGDYKYYKDQLDKKLITQEQYNAKMRAAWSGFAAKVATLGLGLKLAQMFAGRTFVGKTISRVVLFFLSFGIMSPRAKIISGIVASEIALSLFAKQLYENQTLQRLVDKAMFKALDPLFIGGWNLTAGQIDEGLLVDTLWEAYIKAGIMDKDGNAIQNTNNPNVVQPKPEAPASDTTPSVNATPAPAATPGNTYTINADDAWEKLRKGAGSQ